MKRVEPSLEPDPVVEAYKPGIDMTLIEENLKLSIDERFRNLMRLQEFAEELRRAGREARGDKLSSSDRTPDLERR